MFKTKLSKRAQILIVIAIAAMLTLTVSAAVWTYIFKTSYTIGTYVSPPIVSVDLGALFTDTNGHPYGFTGTWGEYNCFGKVWSFVFTLQSIETLQQDFTIFNVTIYTTEHPEGITLTLENPLVVEGLSLQGSITYEIFCITKPNISVARSNMLLISLNVHELAP